MAGKQGTTVDKVAQDGEYQYKVYGMCIYDWHT